MIVMKKIQSKPDSRMLSMLNMLALEYVSWFVLRKKAFDWSGTKVVMSVSRNIILIIKVVV